MSGATFEWNPWFLLLFTSTFFSGLAIKLMDDYLDIPWDTIIGRRTWAAKHQHAVLPYALMALCLACLANPFWAVSLFWASYMLGMRGDLNRALALGLTGWQEALITGALLYIIIGGSTLVTSVGAVFCIQSIDDLMDQRLDLASGSSNWATKWGKVELSLAVLIALGPLIYFQPTKVVMVMVNYPLINWILRPQRDEGGKASENNFALPL